MIGNQLPLNPWLEEIIRKFQKKADEHLLRNGYQLSCEMNENLTWEDFLACKALETKTDREAFLQIRIHEMNLSDAAKRGLYWSGVDTMADLMQITAEELDSICLNEHMGKEEIIEEIGRHEHRLRPRSYPHKTLKLSLKRGWWEIPSPGAPHLFDVTRPSLIPEWLEGYYKSYGHIEGEEKLTGEFMKLRPGVIYGVATNDYNDFIAAANHLWEAYGAICHNHKIRLVVISPPLPESTDEAEQFTPERVLEIWHEAVKAVVDIFIRIAVYRSVPKTYLAETDMSAKLCRSEHESD